MKSNLGFFKGFKKKISLKYAFVLLLTGVGHFLKENYINFGRTPYWESVSLERNGTTNRSKIYKLQIRCNSEMTAEDKKYEAKGKTLKGIYRVVRSIDSKVEDILDELKEHFSCVPESDPGWNGNDYYNNESEYI